MLHFKPVKTDAGYFPVYGWMRLWYKRITSEIKMVNQTKIITSTWGYIHPNQNLFPGQQGGFRFIE